MEGNPVGGPQEDLRPRVDRDGRRGGRGGSSDGDVVLSFRAAADELDVLRNAGHPFFYLGWGRDAMGMVLDADTDWDEVRELVTESYCVLAPKKLIALIDRPSSATDTS